MSDQSFQRLVALSSLAQLSALLAHAAPAMAQTDPSSHTLDTMVVTASGFEQSLRSAPASISVVDAEELERKSFSNIAEALADVPGVDVRSGTGKTGGLNISIRGMPSQYTLILIDGRRQNTSGDITPNGFGETSTSFMPPLSAIERIEVIRGPMSTLYGSDAMGGVINIITKPVGDSWSGSASVAHTWQQHSDAGDDSTVSFFTTGPLVRDRLGVQLRGRVFDRDASERLVPQNPNANPTRDPRPGEALNYSIGGRFSFTPNERDELWLDLDRSRQRYDNADSRLGVLDRSLPPNYSNINGYEDTLRFNRDQISFGHTGRYRLGTLESSIMRTETETLGRTLPRGSAPEYGYEAEGGERRTLENRDLVFDTKFVMPLGAHMVTVGGQYTDGKLTDGAAGSESFEQDTWALFTEDEWWLRDDLALTLGGRYEHHDAFGGHFSPRGYLVWEATDSWTFKGGVGRGYKTPTLNQLHDGITGFGGQGATVTLGSPDLEPEKSTNYELAALYDNNAGFSAGATIFYNRFTDRIASGEGIPNCLNPAGNVPGCITVGNFTQQTEFSQLINIDEAETRGLELTAAYRFNPAWELSGGYTWTDTEIKSGAEQGLVLSNAPKHKLNATLLWDATDRLSTWIEGEYYSSRERFAGGAPTSGQNLALYEQAGDKIKGYTLFNLGASYRLSENVRLNGMIYNLFDKDFGRYDTYTWNGVEYPAFHYTQTAQSTTGVYQDGRRLWLSANYQF
ncbi:TonB-dependent receptor domain-containing protein [Halotalea alkalilenta]|uniref:TonB-dependent receptor domain-containing protein n=1 Tax=Halotalea alkalilenta TaxID=376489 RepID=UPI000484CB76|nr:TonB-dependent receptor [Halotalea alkalilenta]